MLFSSWADTGKLGEELSVSKGGNTTPRAIPITRPLAMIEARINFLAGALTINLMALLSHYQGMLSDRF